MPLRLVMMGTGTFALPTFRALYGTSHEVVGLFTQPDRVGRGHHRHPHPMREEAEARGTPVFQPENVNAPESLDRLRALRADLAVVAAYGQILSAELLATPRLGAINLHASLLPKYRGAAPVQYAVWKGESETGVTVFQIEPRLDAGPILGVVRTPIGREETSGDLEDRLAELAVPLTLGVLDALDRGRAEPLVQESAAATRAKKLRKTDGEIVWSETTAAIDCRIRAMQPWPMPFAWLHAEGHSPRRLQVLEVEPLPESIACDHAGPPGTVVLVEEDRLGVRTGDGVALIRSVRPDGKRAMDVAEFLRGHRVRPGDRFGGEQASIG